MFLKSIEIQGFKSFAHKTVLSFNEGMTAIVGPNGSGKSNIADAVRWVLGEQKVKQLRGQSMQDVIFAGTELRKPLGFAFVSMTFDNTDRSLPLDYQEVTVSRRLYRSGESEYLLNGQNVRLKDVQELFFDTGIGKEGYSIIGQGQVEAIVSGRPEDRRGLFDEACGIVKFKKRKQAALKKLDEEGQALARVTDVLNELERRVGPLEKQSKGAREYLKLRDSLKYYELNLFARDAENLIAELERLDQNLAIVRDNLSDAKEEDSGLKEQNEELSEKMAAAAEEIESCQADLQKAELLIENLGGQQTVLETEITGLSERILQDERSLEKLLENQGTRISSVREYLASLRKLRNEASVIADTEGGEDAEGILTDLSDFEERLLFFLPPEEREEEPEKEASETDSDWEDEEDEFSFTAPAWMKAIRNKRDDLSEIREKEEKIRKWIDSASKEYNSLTEERKKLSEELSEAQGEYQRIVSRYETLKNIQERYEGYGQSVQSVMSMKDRVSGIRGVVADLFHTKKEYEVAVETALGGRIQNIVTDSEETAKKIIGILKRNRLGRATFLPLDAIRVRVQEEYKRACSEEGCLGLASELVDTDTEFEELAGSLLGNTLVFDDVDHAIRCAGKYHHNLRIVTLEGELLSPGGAIAGGSFKNTQNLMGRSRELSELYESGRKASEKVTFVHDRITECDHKIHEKDTELSSLSEQLNETNREKNELSFGIQSDIRVKLETLRQSGQFIRENLERIEQEAESGEQEILAIRNGIADNKHSIEEKKAEIETRKADILHVTNAREEKRAEKEKAEAERERLKASQKAYFDKKDEISDRILALEKDSMRIENTIEKTQVKLDEESGYIWGEYEMTLQDAKAQKDDSLTSLSQIRSEIDSLKASIKSLGPVNVQAIEEYREVSERYELMKSQHEDILKSRGEIEAVITELDQGMKDQFTKEFANIQKEFAVVFRELFGGGEASLELLYDEEEGQSDELSAGIGIIAQPPGKKLQNMMQLSGGEKALTAIALLFAIQNLKPSPFCLLDEIEAALDDSNVLRFAQYIRRISQRTQFILITHRRGTMENADRLYGITMQEKGVTALVSVDLVSDEVK